MDDFKLIKTFPGNDDFEIFQKLTKSLYEKDSQRFTYGNEPVEKYLEACYVLLQNTVSIGRFAFYENPDLIYENERSACFGSYECIDNENVSKYLLEEICNLARQKNYKWLIGPMEGSTWNNYRFSNHNNFTNFFLEPYHHIYYNTHLLNSGFISIADYFSNLDSTLSYDSEKMEYFEEYYLKLGAKIRNLNTDDFLNELIKLAKCSIEGFRNNFLFTNISIDDFVKKYETLKDFFDPELVWIVEDSIGDIHAIVFAIFDRMDKTNQTLIIKSMVNKPHTRFRGVSSFLISKIVKSGIEKGCRRIIHAFMIRDNASEKTSKHYNGKDYKSYTLYGKRL